MTLAKGFLAALLLGLTPLAHAAGPTLTDVLAASPASDWRTPDPENTLYLELAAGRVIIELAPDFAPKHVANIRALARAGYWDGLSIVRVQDNYVVQWGDPDAGGDDARRIPEAAAPALPAEFWTDEALPFLRLREKDVYAPQVGWSRGFPVGHDPAKGQTWLAHCYGMVGAGRDDPPDSGRGTELYAVIGHSPRHLDRNITVVGRVIDGIEHLSSLPRGAGPLGFFEYPDQRIPIHSVRLASDVPPEERTPLQILRTDTATFAHLVETRRERDEHWFVEPSRHVELCNVPIPVRSPPDEAAAPSNASVGTESAPSAGVSVPAPHPTPVAPASAMAPSPAFAAKARACPSQQRRLDGIAGALRLRPDDAALHYYLSGTWAACGDLDRALEELDHASSLNDGFLPVRDLGFERIWDDAQFRARRIALDLALPQTVDAQVVARIPQRDTIPEGLALDRESGRLFVGSRAKGQILAIASDGTPRVFAGRATGLDRVVGLALDAPRHLLYAVSTNQVSPKKDEAPANAVFAFDLATGERKRLLDAAGAELLEDVAVGVDGAVYATDSGSGAVYRAMPGDSELALWMPPDTFPGANGLTLSADGRALYVAHATGIARIQLPGGDLVPRIPNTTRETIAAIDGLYAAGDRLIGVQNVTNPGRVIEIRLDRDGAVVTDVRTLLSHHRPELDQPTGGTVDGDRFLVLANSALAHLQPDGKIRDPDGVHEPTVLAVPLSAPP